LSRQHHIEDNGIGRGFGGHRQRLGQIAHADHAPGMSGEIAAEELDQTGVVVYDQQCFRRSVLGRPTQVNFARLHSDLTTHQAHQLGCQRQRRCRQRRVRWRWLNRDAHASRSGVGEARQRERERI